MHGMPQRIPHQMATSGSARFASRFGHDPDANFRIEGSGLQHVRPGQKDMLATLTLTPKGFRVHNL